MSCYKKKTIHQQRTTLQFFFCFEKMFLFLQKMTGCLHCGKFQQPRLAKSSECIARYCPWHCIRIPGGSHNSDNDIDSAKSSSSDLRDSSMVDKHTQHEKSIDLDCISRNDDILRDVQTKYCQELELLRQENTTLHEEQEFLRDAQQKLRIVFEDLYHGHQRLVESHSTIQFKFDALSREVAVIRELIDNGDELCVLVQSPE